MNCSMPSFPVLHYLPEFAQTHVHCQWCHSTISTTVAPFSSCPQSFPASGSFPMSQLFASGGQSIGVSASVFPVNIQGWFPLGLTSLISSISKTLKSFMQHHSSKASILQCSSFFMVQLSCPNMNPPPTSLPITSLTEVLEKTLESPLDCKEIQPVSPKGNQSWISIGRTDSEAETPILWRPPDAKNWLTGKDLNAGKDWRQQQKGTTKD